MSFDVFETPFRLGRNPFAFGGGTASSAGPVTPAAPTWQSAGLLGANFWGISDYHKDYPFADLVKTSRGFKPTADPYGNTDVTLSGSGWPTQNFVSFLLADGLPGDAGVYTGQFTGQATVSIQTGGDGTLSTPVYNAGLNRTTFTLTLNDSSTSIQLRFESLSGDFADYKFMAPGYDPNADPIFRDEFLNHISTAGILRFMDWQETNGNTDTTWASSKAGNVNSRYLMRNSLKAGTDLCAETGKKGWWCVPASFDDASIGSFVDYLATNTTGSGHVIEFSNETWNFQFTQWAALMTAMKAVANVRSRLAEITSCTKTGGLATLVFASAHGLTTSDQIHVAGITNITGGTVTVTVVDPVTVTWAEAGTATGGISEFSDNSYVYLDITHRYVVPSTTFDQDYGLVPIFTARNRYIVDRCRVIYDALVTEGATDRFTVVLGTQIGSGEMLYFYAYALEEHGATDWLDLRPAFYTYLDPAATATTPELVISRLEQSTLDISVFANRDANVLQSFRKSMNSYEGGPHTHDDAGSLTVKAAISAAHLDDDMRVALKNQMTRWRNVGGELYCHYTYGSFKAIVTGSTGVNDTWPAINGATLNGEGDTRPKYLALLEQAEASPDPVGIDGMTWGTIPLTSAWSLTFPNGDSNGNKVLGPAYLLDVIDNELAVIVVPPAAGDYTLQVNIGANGSSEVITILVNETAVATDHPLPNINPFSTPAPEAWSGTVTLVAGFNRIGLRLTSGRSVHYGLRSLVLS